MEKAQPSFWPHQNDPHKLLAQISAGRATEDYRNNQNIFFQGEVADSVLFIQKGRVKLTVTSEYGKEAAIGIMEEGQSFGEGCLQDQLRRGATAMALSDCRITSITKDAMLSAIRDQPQFSKLFMDHLLSRNSRIHEDLVDQLFNSSEKRLARLLLLPANFGKEGNTTMRPARIYPWRKMRRFRAPSSELDKFFAAHFSAGCIISMSEFDLRQGQEGSERTPNSAAPSTAALQTSCSLGAKHRTWP